MDIKVALLTVVRGRLVHTMEGKEMD